MAKMKRVEVLMSKKLRKDIDEYRVLSGESISGYIRKALYERVLNFKQKNKSDFPMKDVKIITP